MSDTLEYYITIAKFYQFFSVMNCSCEDKVEPREILAEESENLINEIEMYKHHLVEERNILCSSYEYLKVMWRLTRHKSTGRIYQLNF